MLFTNDDMTASATELRRLTAQISASVEALRSANIWSGDDAARFVLDWQERVSEPLQAAANKLDGISLGEIVNVVTSDGSAV